MGPTIFLELTYPLALYLLVWSQSLLGSKLLMFFGFWPVISSRSILTKSERKKGHTYLQSVCSSFLHCHVYKGISLCPSEWWTVLNCCCCYVFNCPLIHVMSCWQRRNVSLEIQRSWPTKQPHTVILPSRITVNVMNNYKWLLLYCESEQQIARWKKQSLHSSS